MKKLALIIGIILMLTTTALAEYGISTLTPDELIRIISMARSALEKYDPVEDDKVLYNRDGFSVTIYSIESIPALDLIDVYVALINDTDKEARFSFNEIFINGWLGETYCSGTKVSPHTKSRNGYFLIRKICQLAGLKSFNEIEYIEAYAQFTANDKVTHMRYIMTHSYKEGLKIISREYLD